MPDIDNKVVSISFNNKQFLRDVEDTISVIEELNEATSGKKIDSSGIENLGRAFRNTTGDLTKQADSVVSAFSNIQSAANTNFQTAGIDALRKALESTGMTATDVEDTITSLQQLSRTGVSYASDLGVSSTAQQIQNESANTRSVLTQDIDDVSNHFSAFEMIAMGAMIAIGEKAADIGANALRSLTSGIRDGWGEYNALTNSTQTILVNTQRWGSTMEDVSGALEELNRYADMTTYSFSDMTRNIGYFTTAGVNLEDSVTAIRGLSNVGAMFGADAQAVARAGYQISQAMSAGVIKLMDWRSMINAGMGGQALQDELIRTAAVMSGTSVDAMN
jgi:tape measure domain-containing protein